MDTIKIEILADGTIKVETDKISGPNHLNATQFLAEMSKLAGGEITIKAKHGKLVQPMTQGNHLTQ
jgi:hypothetical protein